MQRCLSWFLAFLVGVAVGWLGRTSATGTAVSPLQQDLRRMLSRQDAAVTLARNEFEAAPERWETAHRLALELLLMRSCQARAAEEQLPHQEAVPSEPELRDLASRSMQLAVTARERECAELLRERITRELAP